MSRVVVVMAAVWMTGVSTAWAGGTESPQIKVIRDATRRIVTLRAGTLAVTQTLSPTRLDLHVESDGEVVEFAADLEGRVAVRRGAEAHGFAVRRATASDHARLRRIVDGSAALEQLDALIDSAWGRADVAAVFRSAREVMRGLQRDATPVEQFATVRAPASSEVGLMVVRQRLSPSQCWDTYARDVVHFTYELQSCLSSVAAQWWNPLATAWCAYEYNLKSSLASIWLLDCFGVNA